MPFRIELCLERAWLSKEGEAEADAAWKFDELTTDNGRELERGEEVEDVDRVW